MSCAMLVMILIIAVYLCPKQLKIGAKCCSRINFAMADMDKFQRIIVQETLSSEDHVRYVRKNIQLDYMDSNLRKKGVKQDRGTDGNKQITTTCTGFQSLSCASKKFRSDVINL